MIIMGALMLVVLLAALDQTIVSTALPQIASELHGLDKLSWVATAYLLTSAVTTPLYGKISDLYGRKKIFQFAIVTFLIGSILCGAAQNMTQLVVFRALQGVGAGGLFSLAFTIIGDVVSPRERGRYMGYFGAVFGVSSVIGPLLGGFLTESLSWRWVFYVNIPVGLLAFYAVATRLHLPVIRREHKIDFVGAGLLSAGVVSVLLATVWGGITYPWGSGRIIGLFAAGAILTSIFILWERRSPEPILPLGLFKNSIFSVSILLSLLAGIAMFASILYIPEFQQIVRGDSPTKSGLLMLPLVVGILGASITSGKIITKTGRYKIFPIVGTLTLALGLWLFSHIQVNTPQWEVSFWMLIIGAGLGLFMQVMTLTVQNAVEHKDLGVATASATFFRNLGGAFGGAIFGTILINRLTLHIHEQLANVGSTGSAPINIGHIQTGATKLSSLPPDVGLHISEAFVEAFQDMFMYAIPFALLACLAALFLKEIPLKGSKPPIAE
jgi:EmrB/QacA subfamily drug resistance transporter